MKKHSIIGIWRAILLLLLVTGATKAFAQAQFTVGYFQYTITDNVNHTVAIGCDIYATTLPENYFGELPSTVTYENVTYTVTSVSNNAFGNCNKIMGIGIPATVTSIGDYAFTGCENMQAVGIPNTVKDIGEGAFNGCINLQSVKWPENADCWEIKQYTFRNCSSLRKFNVPDNVTTINMEAFSTCTGLQEVYLSGNLTHINAYAFKYCSALTGVYSYNMYPPLINATTFYEAFATNAKIYVPAESLYRYQTAYWEASVNFAWPVRSSDVTADMIEVMPAHKFLKYEYVDDDNDNVIARVIGYIPGISGDLVIPETVSSFNVTEIGVQALEECTGITSVTFPATLTSIGEYAFNGCTGLTTIDLSACNELTTTGKRTFVDCDNATSVILPANLTTIGNHSFASCNALATIELPGAVTRIEIGAFQNCTALTSITFPQSLGIIEQQAFQGCTALASITALRTLPPRAHDYTFADVTKTIPVNIPYGATANYNTANGWSDFTNFVELPANTLLYSYDEVSHTATLTGHVGEVSGLLEIPSVVTKNNVDYTVTAIDDNAFIGCSGLTGVTFPATLTSIGQYAFRECTGITSVVIPSTLTDLGDGAFLWCTSLAEVTLPDNLTRIGKGMFEGAAFTEIELPNSLQVIDKLAFYATSLTSVILPESVTTIGETAFRDCLDLEYVVALPTTPPTINANSFENVERIPLYMTEASYDAYNDDPLWSTIFNTSCRPGLIYNTQTTTATVSGCTPNYVGDLVIPSTFGNKTVVGIEANALKDQQYITSMSIPASVTSIGDGNFKNCPSLASFIVDASNTEYKAVNDVLFNKAGTLLLAYPAGKTATSYDMPYGVVSVSEDAFYKNNSLTAINLSAALNMENPYLFLRDIDNLTTITVDGGSTHYQAENGVLFNYGKTKLLYFPDGKDGNYTIPASASTIGAWSFYNCKNLNSVTINSTVSDIEANAFWGCKGLTAVIIPGSITTLKENTFNNSGLKSVTFLGNVTAIENGAFAGTALTSVMLPASVSNIGTAFAGCESLGEITCKAATVPTTALGAFWNVPTDIPVYVPEASVSAYQNATGWSQFTNIQAITDPNQYITYTYDDNNYTATVTGLSQQYSGALVIPGTVLHNNSTYTVTAIADNAFKDNTGLTSVDIAHTVESIGEYAFSGCISVAELTIGRNVKSIGAYAFGDCIGLTAVHYYATNCETVSDMAWMITNYDLMYVANKTLDIKNCVQTIPACCFYALYGLRNATVTIPNSVTSIGDWAFRYSDINGISIGSGVKTIGKYAFSESSLQSVNVPSNVKDIGTYAFSGCANLASATVWGAKRISVGMFKDCTALTSFDVKSPTKMINSDAFANCTSLATVTTAGYASNLTTIGQEAFTGCTALTAIDIPNSVTTIRDYAFAGDNALETVTFGTGLQSVGFAAFYYCYSLESVTFNATHCNSFSSKVWEGTGNGTKTLTIGTNVNVIPSRAFENLKGFSNITLPNGLTEINYNAFNGCSLTSVTIPNNVTRIGTEAFQNCPLTTLSIGSKVNRIGSDAFNGDSNYLQTITSYNTTPPNIDGPTFHDDAYTNATLKVLGNDAVTAYQNHVVWSRFITIESLDGYYFTGATDNNWGTASNWSNGEVPTSDPLDPSSNEYNPDFTPNVIIMADATVNIPNAYANKLTIIDGNVVTVTSGNKLYIGNNSATYSAANASALVIEEGGQLWNDIDVSATVEKNINGYDRGGDDWHFISSPLKGTQFDDTYGYYIEPDDIENLISGDYDLYKFDQSQEGAQWQNYKYGNNADSFHIFEGMGYLYANATNTKLNFAGTIASNEYEKSVNLYYIDGMTFTGFNLVGNPLACTAYINSMYGFDNLNFYKMNEAGNDIVAVQNISGTPIAACEGILVQTDMSTSTLSFVRELDPMMMSAPNNGSVNITLTKGNERDASAGSANVIDNAIVSFNEGSRLEKFIFNEETSKLYIPQDGTDYAIVSSTGFGELPLNFRAKESDIYTINFRNDNAEMKTLRLIDKIEDKEIDLIANQSYTFVGTPIDREDRFTLMFNASANSTTFAYQDGSDIVVCGNGELQIFDMMGRHITSYNVNGIETVRKPAQSGVYILRIVGDDMKTQKIVVR